MISMPPEEGGISHIDSLCISLPFHVIFFNMSRKEKISIFTAFRNGMSDFFEKGEPEMRHRKSSVSHRIASALERYFPDYSVDIDTDGTDVLVHQGERCILRIFWSSMYLSEKDKRKAIEHHRKGALLTLAFALLPEKDWILVYRFEDDMIEYIHIDKASFKEEVLKRCPIDERADEGQLMLSLAKRRKPAT